eukprot:1729728-Pyramimonas_sp.AAC.2
MFVTCTKPCHVSDNRRWLGCGSVGSARAESVVVKGMGTMRDPQANPSKIRCASHLPIDGILVNLPVTSVHNRAVVATDDAAEAIGDGVRHPDGLYLERTRLEPA